MAYDPQPFVATQVGDAEDAPTGAKPIALYGAGDAEAAPVTWASVTGKPTTFPPTTGTTAATAKPGNYAPAWGEVTGKPTTFPPESHTHTVAQITGLQATITDLTNRIEALETAAG